MVHAFVLVRANVGRATALADSIADLDLVTEGHVVAGDWDLIVEVNAPEVYEVLSAVAEELQAIEGVEDTKTYVSLEE